MNELEREAILGARLEEVQQRRDRAQVKQLVRDRDTAGAGARESRKKTTTGTTAEKTSKLAELKKKRESKKRRADRVRYERPCYTVLTSLCTGRERRRGRQAKAGEIFLVRLG
jgi:hypothetical protein